MKHIDLFSGIGGFALACREAGIETILFCENDKFCQKVLKKHWSDVPIVEDVRNVEEIKGIIANATKLLCDASNNNPRISIKRDQIPQPRNNSRQSLLLTAGFPCQPFSAAGRRKGKADDRYLWPETLAVIEAVNPDWVLLENVAGILSMVFPDSEVGVASQASVFGVPAEEIADYDTITGRIERDLRQAGYDTAWLVIPACAVNAPHRRDRVWVVANATSKGLPGLCKGKQPEQLLYAERGGWQENWYEVATRFCRVDDGVSHRVDRLKSLGNAIVPQVAYEIIMAIKEVMSGSDNNQFQKGKNND